RRTVRTLCRDSFNTRAISRLLTFFAFSSRIAARSCWLSMYFFLLLWRKSRKRNFHSLRHSAQSPARLFDLLLHLSEARTIHFRQRYGEPPVGAFDNGRHHFQIARQRGGLGGGWRLRLPLRFQKQIRSGEDTLAHLARSIAPGFVQLPGFARGAMLGGERGGHAPAIVHIDARHRNQILHRQLRRDLPFADLLLDRLRQCLDQRQTARYPARAAVETAGEFVQRVAELLFHLLQQPTLLQRRFLLAPSQRAVQQQR